MSKQFQNLLAELGSLDSSSKRDISPSYTNKSRRQFGIQTDMSYRNLWNKSQIKYNQFYSPPKSYTQFQDYTSLVYQNDKLKKQIKILQDIVSRGEYKSGSHQKLSLIQKNKKDSQLQEIGKLKKIIQKSYYSIRQMEKKIQGLNEQLSRSNRNCQNLQSKLKIAEFEKEDISRKLTTMVSIHKQDIEICNQRIHKLESRLQQLVSLMEQDQLDWKNHMRELNHFKKFYLQRTYK